MRFSFSVAALAVFLLLAGCVQDQDESVSTPAIDAELVSLGEMLFHDRSLSSEGNQACATCHDPGTAFSDPDKSLPVSKGSVSGRLGRRNTPSIAYASLIPPLHAEVDEGEVLWVGGLFLDGRVDSLEEQATKPFFETNEMNLADAAMLMAKLRLSPSGAVFKTVFGADALDDARLDSLLSRVGQAIAAFERTPAFMPFSSKFDAYRTGKASLSALELEGLSLFVRADKGNCAACHVVSAGPNGEPPVFTDFTYDNIGVPHNAAIATSDADGLASTPKTAGAAGLRGKFRVPTLRNITLTAPYMHNGIFTDLRTVLEFYNTRDTDTARWTAMAPTEVPATVNHAELGNLGLSEHELDALLAFLNTLTDGFTP